MASKMRRVDVDYEDGRQDHASNCDSEYDAMTMLASMMLLVQLSVSEAVGSCTIRPDEYDGEY